MSTYSRAGTGVINTEATVHTPITLSTSVSTIIANENIDRVYFSMSNHHTQLKVWVKLQPADTDNEKKGILLKGNSCWEMPTIHIYTGEISAIADTDSPQVSFTEY